MGYTQSLGDAGGAQRFTQYGQRAADAMIATMRALPPDLRGPMLKAAMAQIDPTLRGRAEAYARIELAGGASDAVALERGLSRAMTEGVLSELVKVGETGRAPTQGSLLGLGCSRGALGSVTAQIANLQPRAPIVPIPSTVCVNPPAGFTWVEAPGVAGHWERLRAGQVPKPGPPGSGCVVDDRGPAGGILVDGKPVAGGNLGESKPGRMMSIGPWLLPMNNKADSNDVGFISMTESAMTPEQRQSLAEGVIHGAGNMLSGNYDFYAISKRVPKIVAPGTGIARGMILQWQLANKTGWKLAWARGQGGPAITLDKFMRGSEPVFGFEHPVTGEKWGIYAKRDTALSHEGSDELDSKPTNPRWTLTAHKQGWDGNVFGSIWGAIKKFVAKVVDIVETVVEAVADLTCKLVSNPLAVPAAAAAGGPPAAAGAAIAQTMCAGAPQQFVPPSSGSSLLLPIGLGVGALVLLAIATAPPKRK